MKRWVLMVVSLLLACGGGGSSTPAPTTTGCFRQENGQFTDTPCPTGFVCTNLGATTTCAPRCQTDMDCSTTGCCQRLTDSSGFARTYGACIAPSGGDRSLCGGPSPMPPSATFEGAYVGMYTATQVSDRPPMDAFTGGESAYGIAATRSTTGVLSFAVDPGCTLATMGLSSAVVEFTAGQRCTPQVVMRNVNLTVASGSASLAGATLTVTLRFRYTRSDAADTGTFDWSYTGTRR